MDVQYRFRDIHNEGSSLVFQVRDLAHLTQTCAGAGEVVLELEDLDL